MEKESVADNVEEEGDDDYDEGDDGDEHHNDDEGDDDKNDDDDEDRHPCIAGPGGNPNICGRCEGKYEPDSGDWWLCSVCNRWLHAACF